ncbi:recombination factor protein RarA [Oceanococcus atlanticus]|uniref:Replication-associated recombination protein A n=1 Tax=Oceanococcus atlanticus TaxID=1317117 RepID=A0A1Y1SFJ3_9GAMM|nr:replication-associated recombination protein A [Oceanococcus atlanticus]ORE88423.1 recombination factor protein RarA [Oceanococcus atlanticus]
MSAPLAERMRPRTLDEVSGQRALLAPSGPLRRALASGRLSSMLFWGPPGVGKTTLARVLAADSGRELRSLSAVQCGVKDLRKAVDELPESPAGIVFIDEVHRFNKAQQDALLPWVESGRIILLGATTENPSFSVNRALLSRLQVMVLKALQADDLVALIARALSAPQGLAGDVKAEPEVIERIAQLADGDARRALGLLEQAATLAQDGQLTLALIEAALKSQPRAFDKGGDEFYDQISALHKSVRGSDPDAALYWLARMLDGGCDPQYIARRLIRMASEDIGNADPRLLGLCLDAAQAYERLGSPEGDLALAQAAVYLACAPKSNAIEMGWMAAQQAVRDGGSQPVPPHLRNAPTRFMKAQGNGQGYRYAHDEPDAVAWGEHYLPDALLGQRYYQPTERGLERSIGDKLQRIRAEQDKTLGQVRQQRGRR